VSANTHPQLSKPEKAATRDEQQLRPLQKNNETKEETKNELGMA
jgi:hypothetical protein